ncbi:MAG: hypothetical protein GX415_06785 [Chloroflexi bacterium]|jgi:hypothetical protein|nr:hypothetical protein [Anaerolineaceae bacterium]NLI45092.1 hypothetical protein [Chloroflexota bacterium]HOE35797.1 hypothetical protein [Anaerolineaceae bacterium]HQK04003.1 hypothetical protein [Anaerolineaceae bacterium]HQL28249.1 hypothetical protein [Anaerolineaceae bacterium]
MTKFWKKLLQAVSISSGILAIALGVVLFRQYNPQMPPAVESAPAIRDPFLAGQPAQPVMVTEAAPSLGLRSGLGRAVITQEPEPTPPPADTWMRFGGVSWLEGQIKAVFTPTCEERRIALPAFSVYAWTPEIFDSGLFEVGKSNVVAWEHLGYTGLWMHSGLDVLGRVQSAFPLQEYMERHISGRLNTPEEFDLKAAQCLIGSQVVFEVNGEKVTGTVSALARVPAAEVAVVSEHVMDLVPYLAETYPESGFAELEAGGLVLYFCGRQLSTEPADMKAGYFSQTRIIVGIAP